MDESKSRSVTGLQIAFLIVALLFIAAPAEKYLFNEWTWARDNGIPVTRFAIFAVAAIVLFGLPSPRRLCVNLLSTSLAKGTTHEIPVGLALNIVAGFAALGAPVLLIWLLGGEPALARRVGDEMKDAEQMSRALALGGILTFLVIGGVIAPILEELTFRGILYPAWARQWGWLRSALATSFVFALVHPNHFAQFFASLIYIGIFRRTGALRAPIIVHGLYNMSMWYPLIGQFIFPASAQGNGEISHFSFNLFCLAFVAIAVPAYLWMSRDKRAIAAVSAQELSR